MLPVLFWGGYHCFSRTLEIQAAERSLCQRETGSGETSVRAEGRIVKMTERDTRKEFLLEDVSLAVESLTATDGTQGVESVKRLLVYLPVYFNAVEGDRVQVMGTLSCFERATNPGQFDYRDHQASLGVNLLLDADSGIVTVRGEGAVAGWLGNLRRYAVSILVEAGGDSGGTMAALVLGDKTYLPDDRYELYLDSGIGHILTLSGLHLSLFGVGLYGILRKRLTLPQWPAAVLMTGGICAYVGMIGDGISASRAAIALIVSLLGGCFGKTYDSLSAAALGMTLILTEYPLQITRSSFWLSFGAVYAMGGFLPALNQWLEPQRRITKALLAALTIQLALMPVTAVNQYTLQTYSILLNMIIVPMMGPLLGGSIAVLMAGMVLPELAKMLSVPINLAFKGLDMLCRFSLSLPGGTVTVGYPAVGRLIGYGVILAGFIVYIYRRNRLDREAMENVEYVEKNFTGLEKRLTVETGKKTVRRWQQLLVISLLLTFVLSVNIGNKWLKIVFLDVGQGDCICIGTPNGTTIIVDAGSSSERKLYEYRLKPYLEWAGIDRLDYLVLTHLDEDHINGALELMQSGFPVGTVLVSSATTDEDKVEEIYTISKEYGIEMVDMSANDKILCGKVEIECVYPDEKSTPESENEASVVLRLTYGKFSCLLTGDLEGGGEKTVEEYLRNVPGITLLKAAHHGSKYSTSESFLQVTQPVAAVISCGEDNSYGHPHQELLQRLEVAGCDIYITAECGAVMVKTDGVRWSIEGYGE